MPRMKPHVIPYCCWIFNSVVAVWYFKSGDYSACLIQSLGAGFCLGLFLHAYLKPTVEA